MSNISHLFVLLFRCNFEYSMCSWYNMKDDEFDFTRHKGVTDSTGTGPKYDHTTGTTSGTYLYAEASWPRKKGDRARIVSDTMNPTMFQRCYLRICLLYTSPSPRDS